MKTSLLAAATGAALLALALPSAAEDQVVATPPCEAAEGVTPVGLAAPAAEEFAAPLVPTAVTTAPGLVDESLSSRTPGSTTTFTYRVDASGSEAVPDARRVPVSFALGWGDDTDFDLYVLDADGDEVASGASFNPLDGAGERTSLTVAHCTDLTVEVVNYAGTPGTAMTLDVTLGKPRA